VWGTFEQILWKFLRINKNLLFFLVRPLPPTNIRRWSLLLHLLALNDIHTDFAGREISPWQRPLPANIQLWQGTDVHSTDRIRTRNRRKWAVADLCLTPYGSWDRPQNFITFLDYSLIIQIIFESAKYYRIIRTANNPDRFGPADKLVENSTKLTSLEITGYRINYSTLLWFLEILITMVESFRRRNI
jgi:hypothetical protein